MRSIPVVLTLVAAVAVRSTADAQQSFRTDATHRAVIFDEPLPGPRETVQLVEGTVYRVEVEPAAARVTIRSARHLDRPPLFLLPLAAPMAGGAAYQLIQRQSGEYRLDVVVAGDGGVRVRIVTDPPETAHWARVQETVAGRKRAGLAVRAVYLGAFPAIRATPAGDSLLYAAGAGADFCIAVVPRGAWLNGRFGGCLANFTLVSRGRDGDALFVSFAPRWMLSPEAAATQLSLVGYLGVGTTTVSRDIGLSQLGLSAMVERGVLGSHSVGLEAEGGLWLISTSGGLSSDAESVVHFALGVHTLF